MDIALVQVCLQAVTATAIAGSVVFAGIQLRAYRRAAYVGNFARLVELQMSLRRLRVEHPELARVHAHDVEDLHTDEEIRHYFLNLMQMSIFEIAWFSHRHGQLPDDYFESWVKRMKRINGEASFRRAMKKDSMKIFHDEFQQYMQDLTRSTPPTPRA